MRRLTTAIILIFAAATNLSSLLNRAISILTKYPEVPLAQRLLKIAEKYKQDLEKDK